MFARSSNVLSFEVANLSQSRPRSSFWCNAGQKVSDCQREVLHTQYAPTPRLHPVRKARVDPPTLIPLPLSCMLRSFRPPSLTCTLMDVLPASIEFSRSSLRAEAGRWTTCRAGAGTDDTHRKDPPLKSEERAPTDCRVSARSRSSIREDDHGNASHLSSCDPVDGLLRELDDPARFVGLCSLCDTAAVTAVAHHRTSVIVDWWCVVRRGRLGKRRGAIVGSGHPPPPQPPPPPPLFPLRSSLLCSSSLLLLQRPRLLYPAHSYINHTYTHFVPRAWDLSAHSYSFRPEPSFTASSKLGTSDGLVFRPFSLMREKKRLRPPS